MTEALASSQPYTLLLRRPEIFGYAAAWGAPFLLDGKNSGGDWEPMGISKVMGTKETMPHFLPTGWGRRWIS